MVLLKSAQLSYYYITWLCFVDSLNFHCISKGERWHVCECVCFLYPTQARVRIRIKGEKVPELLLELQDDDRTQTFLTQVKSAQQQGNSYCLSGSLKQLGA